MGIYQGDTPMSLYGKSAYQQAVEGGYTGTEEEFNQILATIDNKQDKLTGVAGQFVGFDTDGHAVAQDISTPDISVQISEHNADTSAHDDIRQIISNHTGNTETHVTNDEKAAWNAKLDSYTETDPTVPAWAKSSSKPTYTADEVGALPNTLKNNYDAAYTHSQTAHAPSNAEQNVQSDWSVTDTNSDAYIKNKPDVATQADLSAIEAVLTSV